MIGRSVWPVRSESAGARWGPLSAAAMHSSCTKCSERIFRSIYCIAWESGKRGKRRSDWAIYIRVCPHTQRCRRAARASVTESHIECALETSDGRICILRIAANRTRSTHEKNRIFLFSIEWLNGKLMHICLPNMLHKNIERRTMCASRRRERERKQNCTNLKGIHCLRVPICWFAFFSSLRAAVFVFRSFCFSHWRWRRFVLNQYFYTIEFRLTSKRAHDGEIRLLGLLISFNTENKDCK